jgi:hypothetical protein
MDDEVSDEIRDLSLSEIDGRQIEVRLLPELGASPVEVWTADLWEARAGADLPLDVMAPLSVALREGGEAPPPYILSIKRTYGEWGASGVAEDVILEVARWGLEGIAGTIAYNALRRTVLGLVKASRSGRQVVAGERHLTNYEAAERGRWRIRWAFDLSDGEAEQLAVVGGEELADGSRVVRYQLDERRYEVELVERDGLIEIARVGWDRPADPNG